MVMDSKECAAEIMKQISIVMADVEYNRNLQAHLSDVTASIEQLQRLSADASIGRTQGLNYDVFTNHLNRLKEDILRRLLADADTPIMRRL